MFFKLVLKSIPQDYKIARNDQAKYLSERRDSKTNEVTFTSRIFDYYGFLCTYYPMCILFQALGDSIIFLNLYICVCHQF